MICDLHVGFHKTGTTSLQALLAANRARLGAALVNHDDAAMMPLRAACLAFEQRRDANTGRAIARETRALLDGARADRVVISSEILCGPIPSPKRQGAVYQTAAESLQWVQEGAGGAQMRFHACTRDEGKWLSSLYRHLLRTRGLALTEAQFRALPAFAAFRFDALCATIRAKLGALQVWRMEDDLATPLGPGTGFLTQIGLNPAELAQWTPVAAQNPGLSPKAVAVLTTPWALALPVFLRRILARLITTLLPSARGGAA